MTDEHIRQLQRWFKEYVHTFREPDSTHQRSYDLKEAHTARVVEAMERITRALGLGENTRRVAAATALFHDLGRFPQYQRYRTFRDRDSENHAKLSVRELIRHRVLNVLVPAERQLIGRAITFHNRMQFPGHLDPETLLHSRLIRDADKVDILRVMAEELQKPQSLRNPVITLGLDCQLGVREEVYRRLFAGEVMSYAELDNVNEFKVLQMSWVFDINFLPTFEILRERDHIDVIAATLPDTPIRCEALAFVKAYIERRLEEGGEGTEAMV
jgi:hypothetical protein